MSTALDSSPPEAIPDLGRAVPERRSLTEWTAERMGRRWLMILLIAGALTFVWMCRIFIVPAVVAAVFTALTYPMYEGLVRLLRGRRGTAALVSCLLVLLGILVPMYLVLSLVATELGDLYKTAEPGLLAFLERASESIDSATYQSITETLRIPSWAPPISLEQIEWQNVLSSVGNNLAGVIRGTSQGALQVVATLFIVLFTMFYFYRDGESIIGRLRYLSPLDETYESLLISRMVSTSRATLRATLIIGLIQGSLGALTLSYTGISAPVLWGLAMWVLALFPLIGTWVVMYPIAIVQLVQGNVKEGLIILFMTVVVISTIDNIIRPRLIGRRAGMHDLLVFFSTIGGLALFGLLGIIVGPILAAVFVALLDIYAMEFKPQLEQGLRSAQAQAQQEVALQLDK